MRVDFYQLSRDPVEQVLPAIAQRLMDEGERLLVIDGRAGALERLSTALWSWRPDSFLAHGTTDGEDAALQPVLLSSGEGGADDAPANAARHVAFTDGIWREEATQYARAFYFFDAETLESARACWRRLRGLDGNELHFWRQEGRRWVQGP